MAFFRLGEQENCLATHNADSCVFPLKPKAYHLLPRGSRGAIAMFSAHLAEIPERFQHALAAQPRPHDPRRISRQSEPAAYLIPPEKFASEYDMPRFLDVSDGLGIDANDLAGGALWMTSTTTGSTTSSYRPGIKKVSSVISTTMAMAHSVERTSEAGLVGEVGALNIQQTDYNNDGCSTSG